MARKIHIDSDNTIQQWIDSQNTMSDYMGNLDSFRPDIINAFDSDANVSSGTSFVTALNYIYNPLLTRILNIFNGTGAINIGSLELMIESATINVLKLENHDSGLKLGVGPHSGSHLYAADAFVDSFYADGDSPGSTNLIESILNQYVHLIPAVTHDLYVESSGTFNNIVVDSAFSADSGTFDMINIIDSGHIDQLTVDSTGVITISQCHILNFDSGNDSFNISSILRTKNIVGDSAIISKASINNLILDSDLNFDGRRFRTASKFLITDSASPDTASDPGVIYFGGFKLDSV